MRITVNDQMVDPNRVTIQGFGFGQPHPRAEPQDYVLSLGIAVANRRLESWYRDLAEDDAEFGDDDEDPIFLALRTLGWPPLNILTAKDQALARELYLFAGRTLFERLFADRPSNAPLAITSIDRVEIEGRELNYYGQLYDLSAVMDEPLPRARGDEL